MKAKYSHYLTLLNSWIYYVVYSVETFPVTAECRFRLQDALSVWCEKTAASVGKH